MLDGYISCQWVMQTQGEDTVTASLSMGKLTVHVQMVLASIMCNLFK